MTAFGRPQDSTSLSGVIQSADSSGLVGRIIYIEIPSATDEYPIGYVPGRATIIEVIAVTDAGTVDFNIEKRSKLTPDVAGTNIFTADKVATSSGLDQTSIDSPLVENQWLVLDSSALVTATVLYIAIVLRDV